jgi:hypothetical protein
MTEDESRKSTEHSMKSIKHSNLTHAANRGYELRRNKKVIVSNITNMTIASYTYQCKKSDYAFR